MFAKLNSITRFSLFTLFFNVCVILWGAVVRATGSGAGCNDHWPRCDGEIIPTVMSAAKAIEFTHRVTSGLAVLLIFGMLIWVLFGTEKGSPVRKGAKFSAFFGVIECLIGAGLVLLKLVEKNDSPLRAIVLAFHHVNTTFLVASLILTSFWAAGGSMFTIKRQGAVLGAIVVSVVGMIAMIVSGSVTALGDTLFKRNSPAESMNAALAVGSHFLDRLKLFHPIISISVSLYLILGLTMIARFRSSELTQKLSHWVTGIIVFQLAVGALNVYLHAPVWMQVFHLLVSNIVWGLMIWMFASCLAMQPEGEEILANDRAQVTRKEKVQAYIALTKPRIISLLLFTTLAAMFIAKGGWPGGWLLLWVGIGGYMSAGAANTVNMIIDADIDVKMERTSKRPTITGVITHSEALGFALILAIGSFVMISIAANVLAALMAWAGLLFYVFIYTLLLKRRTWNNIVIGGAAGAFPPLVGYTAVTGQLSPLAWFLFAVIFFWTPVHFWALALLIKDEYASVGIPMLPVVKGERATVIQITAYAILTAIISIIPFMQNELSYLYLVGGALLNAILVLYSFQLMNHPDKPKAKKLFKYSMIYLALLFVVIAVDRAFSTPKPPAQSRGVGVSLELALQCSTVQPENSNLAG